VQYQRHKVRLASSYDLDMGRIGRATLGVLYRYDSPLAYGLSAANVPFTAIQRSLNPGYASVPTTQTLWFSDRGAFDFEAAHLLDVAVNYDLPVWKTARPYFKGELRNSFNAQPLIGFDTTITPNNAGPVDALGLPTEFVKGPNFGKNTVLTHNPTPREFRFSVGFRF
jgi:hypothetical protein